MDNLDSTTTSSTETSKSDLPPIISPRSIVHDNPLESSSRWYLNARASAVRYAASLGFSIANRSGPSCPTPSAEFWLDSTLSEYKGPQKIKVEVWSSARKLSGPRAAVINFHGGGWILGQGTDDARWAAAVMDALDAVVFTVNYRLAPSYPFPVPIEDCIDSVLQIVQRAAEFDIDPNTLILSGFSAGATNALASWIALHDPARWKYDLPASPPHIAGLVLFYPTLDVTISRPEKRQACPRPELTLTSSMTNLIDASYFYPNKSCEQRLDPRLSPGLMSDELLMELPPIHLCLCENDMLLAEGVRFACRLRSNDKPVSLRIVEGETHGWDKPPPMVPKESVYTEYKAASWQMARWLGRAGKADGSPFSSHSQGSGPSRPKLPPFRSRTARFL